MKNCNLESSRRKFAAESGVPRFSGVFSFTFAFLLIVIAGCAAPGAPIARMPAVAPAIANLAATQTGANVILTFTLPKETLQGQPLEKTPSIEIYREFLPASAQNVQTGQPAAPQQLVLRVDSQAANQYRVGDKMSIPAPLSADEIAAHAGENAIFSVRTRISSRDSADSNLAEARVFPPPATVQNLAAQVTKTAVELSWNPVQAPSTAALGPASIRYRIYRKEEAQAAAQGASAGASVTGAAATEFALLGESESPAFNDTNFTFGTSYAYVVRSVAQYESGEIESADSKILEVTPRDTFPPTAPTGLVAAVIPATTTQGAQVDLSWAISPETDIAGYNVYRRDEETSAGEKLNSQLLLTPAYRDASATTGHSYFYRATSVDHAGNESERSTAVEVTVPGPKE